MGKTHQPLNILVHHAIADLPVWAELREKGHTVDVAYSDSGMTVATYDAYFGPNAWWMNADLSKYVMSGVTRARKVRYGKAEKR